VDPKIACSLSIITHKVHFEKWMIVLGHFEISVKHEDLLSNTTKEAFKCATPSHLLGLFIVIIDMKLDLIVIY
jgi:hypothetical protein